MKLDKQRVLFSAMSDMVETAVDLGMAKQRHIDAASEEQSAGESLQEIGLYIQNLITGEEPTPPTVH